MHINKFAWVELNNQTSRLLPTSGIIELIRINDTIHKAKL